MKIIFICTMFVFLNNAFAGEGDCSKDGKSLEVTGESSEMKKAACEAEKGVWTETVEAPKQTAGPTGGW